MKSGPKPAGDRTSWKSERCDYAPLSNNTYSLSTLTCRPPWGRLRPARPSLRSWPPKRNVFNIPRSARAGKPRFVCQTVIFLSRVSVITGKQSCRFGRFPSTCAARTSPRYAHSRPRGKCLIPLQQISQTDRSACTSENRRQIRYGAYIGFFILFVT